MVANTKTPPHPTRSLTFSPCTLKLVFIANAGGVIKARNCVVTTVKFNVPTKLVVHEFTGFFRYVKAR